MTDQPVEYCSGIPKDVPLSRSQREASQCDTGGSHCVFCGKPIPPSELSLPFVKHLYCSTSCAHRQQLALKRLRDTTPADD